MARPSMGLLSLLRILFFVLIFAVIFSNVFLYVYRTSFTSCDGNSEEDKLLEQALWSLTAPNPLAFMYDKDVLLVSHDLSLSDGPLLLMELAFLLRSAGANVYWTTNQRSSETDAVIHSLERRLFDRGVKVLPAKGKQTIRTALEADLLVLNTVMAGKWLDHVPKESISSVLPKVMWWIHEMQDHHFKSENLKHLPEVFRVIIDSHVAAKYLKNKIEDLFGIQMADIFVIHPGNSKGLMEIAASSVAKSILREHVRESLGLQREDLVFAMIDSVSEEKGQDLFLQSFYEALQLIKQRGLWAPSIHAVIVGVDINAQSMFESELHEFRRAKKIEQRVHFVSKSLTAIPYLAAIDVLVRNSQGPGECFGRTTIEAMAFSLPVLGTAVGGTTEIVVNESTGLLHPTGVEGVTLLANNIMRLATQVYRRVDMGKRGYERVKESFLGSHMSEKIALAMMGVFQNAESGEYVDYDEFF